MQELIPTLLGRRSGLAARALVDIFLGGRMVVQINGDLKGQRDGKEDYYGMYGANRFHSVLIEVH